MKIVNPSAAGGGGNQKPGVAGATHPFKKVMSGGNEAKGKLPAPGLKPMAAPKALPGGVKPKTSVTRLPPALKAVSSNGAATVRQTARAQAHAQAENLVELRQHALTQNAQRYDTRLVDLICQELKIEFANQEVPAPKPHAAANSDRFEARPAPVAEAQQAATVTPISQAKREAEVKAASAVELIEKIETFVKSQRPALAIALDGSLGARVEIERLGPKEVAIRLVGKNGPPAPEDVGRIREEMRARGLKVGALSVA